MPSAIRQILVVLSAVFVVVTIASPATHEPSMTQQNAQSTEQATGAAIDRFNEAFNRHEACLTDDTVFEDTSPAPDGRRIEGKSAVVEFWRA